MNDPIGATIVLRGPRGAIALFLDVVDLRNFYAQPLGTVARRFVSRGIRARWSDTRAQRIAGIGYATPYLGLFREEAERCLAFMPAAQGVVKWPSDRRALAALVDELEMPPCDSAVDRANPGADTQRAEGLARRSDPHRIAHGALSGSPRGVAAHGRNRG